MRCPVCKTECTGFDTCPKCGFEELNTVFINSDEANLWKEEIVGTYRKLFYSAYVGMVPFDDLSDEQKQAVMLPFEKSCLVVGSAGTGKTMVGLNRAFLTSGKTLYVTNSTSAKCFKREFENKKGFENVKFVEASSVVRIIWEDLFVEKMPCKDWDPDMDAIKERILPLGNIYNCIILDIDAYGNIDYNFLNAISETVYTLIDKNTIVEWFFNFNDFKHSMCINETIELTRNYRNTYSISCFVEKYKRSDVFSFGTRNGESIQLLRYKGNKNDKYHIISEVVKMNRGKKIGIVVNFSEINELVEYLKRTCEDRKVVNYWSFRDEVNILSDEKYVGVASNLNLCSTEFDVLIVMLNDALESMPECESANKRCLYQLFSIAREKLYVGISNEIPLKNQGKRILDERASFEKCVDYTWYEEV